MPNSESGSVPAAKPRTWKSVCKRARKYGLPMFLVTADPQSLTTKSVTITVGTSVFIYTPTTLGVLVLTGWTSLRTMLAP